MHRTWRPLAKCGLGVHGTVSYERVKLFCLHYSMPKAVIRLEMDGIFPHLTLSSVLEVLFFESNSLIFCTVNDSFNQCFWTGTCMCKGNV